MGGEVLRVKISGLNESMEALSMFGDQIVTLWGKRATFNGAAVIKKQAIANAPVLQKIDDRRIAGALRDSIAIFKRRSDVGKTFYIIGTRRIKLGTKLKSVLKTLRKAGLSVNIQGDVFYVHLSEFGFTDPAGKKHPGTRFMTRAFESAKGACVEEFSLTLSQGVVEAVVKAKVNG